MKTLILIRHAKSSWGDASLNDFDRPLNERGKKNAPAMAKRLHKQKMQIDLFVSSPAKRAKGTAKLFVEELKKDPNEILVIPKLYEADVQTFYTVVSELEDNYKTVALFSHNPGITGFANSLTEVRVDNIPTCGIYAINADVEKWSEFSGSKKTFLFFDYPKSDGKD